MTNTVESLKKQAAEFVNQLNKGVAAWTSAGRILARMVDDNPNAFKTIREIAPHISMDVLIAFEKIGRNQIYPYLLLDHSPGMKRLAQLPYPVQEKYYHERVKVVTGMTEIGLTVIQKSVAELSAQQAELVISATGIRSVKEQEKLFFAKDEKHKGVRGHVGHRSGLVPEEASKFQSIGCFRMTLSTNGKPALLRTAHVGVSQVIELKAKDGNACSDPFEIVVDKILVKIEEDEPPEEEHGLDSAVQNQIEELTRRRAEFTAMLRTKPEKKAETEKAIKEINRKIASLQSIA